MRVMVTGGTGFVGLHTVIALRRAGHEVCLLVRSPEKMQRVFASLELGQLDSVRGDIVDEDSVKRALAGCDAVVHSAAMVSVRAKDAQTVFDTNTRGTELVIGSALDANIDRIVQVSSTTALFRAGLDRVDELSGLGVGKTGYGRSKVECDRYVRRLQDSGVRIYSTYPGSVIGPEDPGLSEAMAGLVTCIDYASVITSSGIQLIDVRDVALAHLRMLERGGPPARYPMGGHFLPWAEFAKVLEEASGVHIRRLKTSPGVLRGLGRVIDFTSRYITVNSPVSLESVDYATNWVAADDSAVKRDLGIEYRDVLDSLRDAIAWLRRNGKFKRKQLQP